MLNVAKSFLTQVKDLEKLPIQEVSEGVGPVVEKFYEVAIPSSWEDLLSAFEELRKDINKYAPTFLGKYHTQGGQEITKGKRLLVDMLGPYNAPIEASTVKSNQIRLMTLQNHPEAGYVEFLLKRGSPNRFVVHSFSRAADVVFHLGFNYLYLASFIQNQMWRQFAQNFFHQIKGRYPHQEEISFKKKS